MGYDTGLDFFYIPKKKCTERERFKVGIPMVNKK